MRVLALLFCTLLSASGQYRSSQPLSESDIIFARIRKAVSASLDHQPDFTCVETIERSQRVSQKGKFQLLDNVRLEVALVNGKELYAWPGSPKFEDRPLRDMVSGTIGTGDFALHAKNLFLGGVATFRYQGIEEINGRKAHKFHFKVPMDRSPFMIRVDVADGAVGYEGHVWNDATTYELIRIDFEVTEVPPGMPLMGGHKQIDYAPVVIGGATYNLPASTEMTLSHVSGTENRNRMVFSACRQYTGESTLVFDEPPPSKPEPPKAAAVEITLPEGLTVMLKLITPIDLSKTAIGEASIWEVTRTVQRKGRELIPKGARLEMRVDHFGCTPYPVAYCFLGLQPGRISFGNKAGDFRAELTSPDMTQTFENLTRGINSRERVPMPEMGNVSKESGVLILRGAHPKLASGSLTTWRTL